MINKTGKKSILSLKISLPRLFEGFWMEKSSKTRKKPQKTDFP